MNFSDNLGALIYLKNRVHKWKNIAFFFAIFSIALIIKTFFDVGSDSIGNSVALIKVESVITEDDHRSKILKEIASNIIVSTAMKKGEEMYICLQTIHCK